MAIHLEGSDVSREEEQEPETQAPTFQLSLLITAKATLIIQVQSGFFTPSLD